MRRIILYAIILLFPLWHTIVAQDYSNIKEIEPFTITGGIGAGLNYFTSNSSQMYRSPLSWNVYGDLTPTIYGLALPLSFSISQYSRSYSTPYSQFGISPSYKWIKVHAGYRHISFSPLIFDGQTFLGGGIELSPGAFRFAAFYGRLNKSITIDTTIDKRLEPQFSRKGYGVKIGFEENGNYTHLSFFHAIDDPESLETPLNPEFGITPQENTALGLSWSYNFFKVLTFSGDIAASLLNRNMFYNSLDSIGDTEISQFLSYLTEVNPTSTLSFSGRGSLRLNLNNFHFGINYRRVEPDYLSLGIPYTVNDIENINATLSTQLFKNKMNISAVANRQHNNLSGKALTEIQATSGNLSINTRLGKSFVLNLNGNAAYVYQEDGTIQLNDNARMNQLMLSYSISPSYHSFSTIMQHTASANVSFTDLKDFNPATKEQAGGDNLNISVNYGLQLIQSQLGLNAGSSYSVYGQQDYRYQSVGINIGGNAQLLQSKKLGVNLNIGYFFNKSNNENVGNNTSFSAGANYKLDKHSFNLSSSYILTPPINLNPLDKINQIPIAVNTQNFTFSLNYNYRF